MDVHAAVVLLDRAGRLVPRALLPGVRIPLVEALAFGQQEHPLGHVGTVFGRDVIERRVSIPGHQVLDGFAGRDIVALFQERLGVEVLSPDTITDEDDTMALLGDSVVGRAERRDVHRITGLLEVLDDHTLDGAIQHRAKANDVLADDELGLQVLHNLQELAVKGIARVVDDTIASHTEALAGEAAGDDREFTTSQPILNLSVELRLLLGKADISFDEGVMEVTAVGLARLREPIESAYTFKAGKFHPLGDTPGTGE